MSRWPAVVDAVTRIVFALWIGAVAAIAFIAAPLVFGAVPESVATKDEAARIIGPAFGRVDRMGLAACFLALMAILRRPLAGGMRWRLAGILFLMGCAALDGFFLAPKITARTEPLGVYHGLATAAWMAILIVGAALLAAGLLPRPSEASSSPD